MVQIFPEYNFNQFERFDSDKSGEIDFKVIFQFDILKSVAQWVDFIYPLLLNGWISSIHFCSTGGFHLSNFAQWWISSIHLKEFMLATNMAESGSPEEKLRWAFKMYDKDGSGGFLEKISNIPKKYSNMILRNGGYE